MTLRFVGIDPNTGGEGSPTVWVEEESADLVLQGEEADELLKAVAGSTEWVAGHRAGIPPHERGDPDSGSHGVDSEGGVRCR